MNILHKSQQKQPLHSVKRYLDHLETAMEGCDPALIQDALTDAEEYLHSGLEAEQDKNPDATDREILPLLIEKYGSPEETAAAYRNMEERLSISAGKKGRQESGGSFCGFLRIFKSGRAWSSLIYMIFSISGLITGMWTLIGMSLSFLLPVALIFFPSLHVLGLLEGRTIQALLGVRMPQKLLFFQRGMRLTEQYKILLTRPETWKTAAYLISRIPLGLLYFSLHIILAAVSLKLILMPILGPVFGRPLITLDGHMIFSPAWAYPLLFAAGILSAAAVLHLASAVGRLHARWAKTMLVKRTGARRVENQS